MPEKTNGRKTEVICKWCGNKLLAYWIQRHFLSCPMAPAKQAGFKMCSHCQNQIPLREFPICKTRKDGLSYNCRPCDRELTAEWYASPANAERQRERNFKANYGITVSDYDAAFADQGGRCALCGAPPPEGKRAKHFHVDHDHDTGKFRGLLCHHCNHGLGKFDDDWRRILRATNWVRVYRGLKPIPEPND